MAGAVIHKENVAQHAAKLQSSLTNALYNAAVNFADRLVTAEADHKIAATRDAGPSHFFFLVQQAARADWNANELERIVATYREHPYDKPTEDMAYDAGALLFGGSHVTKRIIQNEVLIPFFDALVTDLHVIMQLLGPGAEISGGAIVAFYTYPRAGILREMYKAVDPRTTPECRGCDPRTGFRFFKNYKDHCLCMNCFGQLPLARRLGDRYLTIINNSVETEPLK